MNALLHCKPTHERKISGTLWQISSLVSINHSLILPISPPECNQEIIRIQVPNPVAPNTLHKSEKNARELVRLRSFTLPDISEPPVMPAQSAKTTGGIMLRLHFSILSQPHSPHRSESASDTRYRRSVWGSVTVYRMQTPDCNWFRTVSGNSAGPGEAYSHRFRT